MTTSDELVALAEEGRKTIETAILRLLGAYPEGLGNAQITTILGLRSSFKGNHRNYLTHSVLGGLLTRGLVEQDETTKLYKALMPASNELAVVAEEGRRAVETAILRLLEAHPEGLRNAEIAESLGLRSSFKAGHKNYLTHSVLGGLLTRGLVEQDEATKLYKSV